MEKLAFSNDFLNFSQMAYNGNILENSAMHNMINMHTLHSSVQGEAEQVW